MKKTKHLTFCAIMAALGVVVLFLFSLADVLSLTAVLIASLFLFVTAEELGTFKAFMVYLVSGILAAVLISSKLTAVEYFIFGFYPVIKRLIEKTGKVPSLIFKALYIIIATAADMLIIKFFFPTGDEKLIVQIFTVVISVVWLILYDVCYTRLSRLYHFKLRHQLRIDKFFE